MKIFFKKHKTIILSYIICVVIGTISHFLYDLTYNFFILKPFVSIDESIFEHLKLIFYPIIIVSFFEGLIVYQNPLKNISTRNISCLISIILLIIFYYTYTSFTNKSIVFIDIISYYLFIFLAYYLSLKLEIFNNNIFKAISYIILFIAIIIFSIFTEYKPNIDFFK